MLTINLAIYPAVFLSGTAWNQLAMFDRKNTLAAAPGNLLPVGWPGLGVWVPMLVITNEMVTINQRGISWI
jgi:hypothetical protein